MELNKIKSDLEKLLYNLGGTLKEGFYSKDKDVKTKENVNDVLTKYDIKINNEMLNNLKKNYPNFSVISEESPKISRKSEYTFIVDPIDGTRNFTRNLPVFYIGIALVKNNQTILSMTYNPIMNEMFWAIKGGGAYLNDSRIHVSNNKLENSDVSIGYRKDKTIHKKIISEISDKIFVIKNSNCIHNDLGAISFGRIDGLVHKGAKIWDYCHYLLVEEAGGKVTDWKGDKFDITKDSIIASNGVIHDELLKIVR